MNWLIKGKSILLPDSVDKFLQTSTNVGALCTSDFCWVRSSRSTSCNSVCQQCYSLYHLSQYFVAGFWFRGNKFFGWWSQHCKINLQIYKSTLNSHRAQQNDENENEIFLADGHYRLNLQSQRCRNRWQTFQIVILFVALQSDRCFEPFDGLLEIFLI